MAAYSGPRIKIKSLLRLPAREVDGPGISNTLLNGTRTIGLDIVSLSTAVSIPDPSIYQTFIYNTATATWEKTPLSNVPTTTTGDVYTGHGNSAFIIANTDRYIALTAALTAPRTWTLPAASAVPAGTRITFHDEIAGVSSTNTLTFGPTGADTINGTTTFVLNVARAGIEFRSDGISKWTVGLVGTSAVADGFLAATAAGLAKMADGFLAASTAALAKMADGFFTATAGARAKFADGFMPNAKLADMATATFKMRASAGTGAPEDGTAGQALAAISAAQGPLSGFRNLLINGSFRVNQRAFAGGALAAGIYGHDRWKGGAAGGTYTVSGAVATITAGTIVQVIEGLNIETTGTYVINWTGTATVTVDGVAKTKGATFTLTRGTNATLVVAAGTFSFPQIEAGDAATSFETRPYPTELVLCQRYFETTGAGGRVIGSGFCFNSSVAIGVWTYKVSKRTAPTPAVLGTAANFVVTNSAASVASNAAPQFIDGGGANLAACCFRFNTPASLTTASGCLFDCTNDAQLTVSCEL